MLHPGTGSDGGLRSDARIIGGAMPNTVHPAVIESDYWRYLLTVPGPKVAVVQDLDTEPVGSIWGEVNAKPPSSGARLRGDAHARGAP